MGVLEWLRQVQLVVGKGGTGLDVSRLRVQFTIIKSVDATPNSATIKVFNLAPQNAESIKQAYTDILLNAGYVGAVKQIFAGNIQFVSYYRESTDYITEITAGDGYMDFRNSYINSTLAAGTTDGEAINQIAGQMRNTRPGVNQVAGTGRLRGKVLSGEPRQLLTQVSGSNGANWSIQDGELEIVRSDSSIGIAQVVSHDTGLLEAPVRNDKGIYVKCLLNPEIAVNGAIQLENTSIRVKAPPSKPLGNTQVVSGPVGLNPAGIYKCLKVTHTGDTYGNDWFTEVECISMGDPVPASRQPVNYTGTAVPLQGM